MQLVNILVVAALSTVELAAGAPVPNEKVRRENK